MHTEKYKGYTIQVGSDLPGTGLQVAVNGVHITHEFDSTTPRHPPYRSVFGMVKMMIDADQIDMILDRWRSSQV